MRITKRSSGGRGEYEISQDSWGITPRDLLNHTIVLDLGAGIEIATGVQLLLRHGKRRLRIDELAGGEMQLHRQLAAALMLPYPARDERTWAAGAPVMQSGLYGIGSIEFSSVTLLDNGIACVAVASVAAVNRGGEDYVQGPERMAEIQRVWKRQSDFPPHVAGLIGEHERLVRAGDPLGPRAENVVSSLQEAAVAYCQVQGLGHFSLSHDVLPVLLCLLQAGSPGEQPSTLAVAMPPPLHVGMGDTLGAADEGTAVEGQEDTHRLVEADIPSGELPGLEDAESIPDSQTAGPEEEASAPDLDAAHVVMPEQEGTVVENEASASVEHAVQPARTPPLPRQYQPQPRSPVVTAAGRSRGLPSMEQRDISVPIDIRLRSRTGGSYGLSFLPRRRAGMPAELGAIHAGKPIQLSALHDDWYHDVVLPEAGRHLREGMAWHGDGQDRRFRWALAGRELYVLGARDGLSGFVSVPRLVLGAQHVVLCTQQILQRVVEVLQGCCETMPAAFDEHDGLPTGWVGLRPVVPTLPLPPSEAGDILDALRPDPDISIALEGGIRLQYSQFLAGYPPKVRVYGSVPAYAQVLIDGQPAEKSDEAFTAASWDAPGEHVVACGAVSRTYMIVTPEDGWESWPAYSFSLQTIRSSKAAPSICGALVGEGEYPQTPVRLVPASTPVLLGSQPGQIYAAPIRHDVRMSVCPAFPLFSPVWAVPQDPLLADKATARILLLQNSMPAVPDRHARPLRPSGLALQWCKVILDCCRKGLIIEPQEEEARQLWRSYRALARSLWRASQ